MGIWMVPENKKSGESEKMPDDYLYMPNNISSMKYALKSIPGLADVGDLHEDGPRAPPRCLEGSGKNFK